MHACKTRGNCQHFPRFLVLKHLKNEIQAWKTRLAWIFALKFCHHSCGLVAFYFPSFLAFSRQNRTFCLSNIIEVWEGPFWGIEKDKWWIRGSKIQLTGGKSARKKFTQNKKVHLNKFFWTICAIAGKKANVRANFSEKLVQTRCFVLVFHVRDGETTIKIKFSLFEGGALGAEGKIVQNAVFRGKRHDNKILNLKILLSRNFVVIAQAPIMILGGFLPACAPLCCKNMCCASRFCTGGRGAAGSRSKQCPRVRKANC